MSIQRKRIRSYSAFIEKLIRAGRNDGTKAYFNLGIEIDRIDFIKFANRFIENYYATVSPEFAITHPMKFSFGKIQQDGLLAMNSTISSKESDRYPGLDGGLLYIKIHNGHDGDDYNLDGSIFRQACFIKRERFKFHMAVIGSIAAIAALILPLIIQK